MPTALPHNRSRSIEKSPPVFDCGVYLPGPVMLLAILLICATQPGCQIFSRFGGKVDNVPILYNQLPSQQELLANLNARSARVRQLNSSVTVTMPGVPKIKGTLQVEFPDRMRMKAGLAGISEMGVDVGSNAEQFWIWSKADLPGQPPALYFANHQEFERSPVRQAIPMEPKWLIDSLGLVAFRTDDVHYGPVLAADGRMKLFTVRQTPNGPQTRQILISSSTGLIEQQAAYDSSNRLIAYTNSSKYKNYAEHQVSLPQRIEMHMIQPDGQDVEMVVDLGSFSIGTPTVKALYGDPVKMWAMPDPVGVPKVDLARVSPVNPQNTPNQGHGVRQLNQPPVQRFPQGARGTNPGTIR